MTKKIKNYKMPSLFVSLFFIIIIFFSSKSVFGVSNIPEKGELHETYYNICGLDVRNNEALFCVQPMTDMLWENNGNKKYKYKVVGKISIDSQKKEFKREGNTSKLKSDDAAISIIAFTDYSKTDKYKKNVEEYKEGSKSYIKGLTPWEQIVITDPTQYLIWYLHEGAIRADGEKKWDEIIEKMDANGVFKDNTEKEFFSIFSKVAFVLWFRDMPVTPTKADILARKEIKADQSVEPKIDYDASKNNEVLAKRVQNLPTGTNLEDYIVVGPYRYSASGEDCISQILVKKNGENNYNDIKPGSNILVLSKTPEGTYKPIYSLDEKNNIINDKISPEFYVLVRKNKGIAKIDDLKLIFTPHLVPMNRGILVTAYANLAKDVTYEDVKAAYDKYYDKEYFVRVLPKDVCPETRWVEGSNFVDIGFKIEPRTNRIIAMGALDNLVKGAAGQAVQNMNLLFGFEENEGLKIAPMFP